MKDLKTLILAAGAGTRMKSNKAKVLHEVSGKTMLKHVIDAAKQAGSNEIAVIIGHQGEQVREEVPADVKIYEQKEQLGTGHAVMQAKEFLDSPSTILVLNGDAPLISPQTIENIFKVHNQNGNAVTVLTAELENPTGYGRILTKDGEILRIVEEKDANKTEKAIKEVNSGIYCFDSNVLNDVLGEIKQDNNQGEYYLTDTVELIKDKGLKAGRVLLEDNREIFAVNSRDQLVQVIEIYRDQVNNKLLHEGITLLDPKTTYIDSTVEIGIDTIIYPNVTLEGNTKIGENCIIRSNTRIKDSIIQDSVEVESSTILESEIGSNTTVGPYAYIRPDCKVGNNVKVGDFVELKNSTIGNNTKVPHLIYVGDADVGSNVNIGCGSIFVNYNGKDKFRSVVEDDCFIGCNTNIVAPVTIQKGSFTAAGSTITEDVPEETLAIARAKQVNKKGYVNKLPYKN